MDPSLKQLTEDLLAFRDARDWGQFHTLKNLKLSLSLEASELLEIAQWKSEEELLDYVHSPAGRTAMSDECADILIYLLLICHACDIDLIQAARAKMQKNAEKYPVEKARGTAKKYTEL